MASGREGNSETQRRTCPECGAEFLVQDEPRQRRFSIMRGASATGHSSNGQSSNGGNPVATDSADPFARVSHQIGLDQGQTFSDRDQTGSDRDQTASDRDQTASDRDEETSADDQEASDRELAAGGDRAEYERSKLARSRASIERLNTARVRDDTAVDRGQIATERDRIAESRDRVAAGTDDLADLLSQPTDPSQREGLPRGNGYFRTEANRARAANDRATAASDRERAANDREEAASLRAAAARDRADAVRERQLAGIDQLTGVSLRSVGLGDVEREIERSRRTGRPLVLVFVDVNNLKAVNDNDGHIAGDVLLRRVADMLRLKLRPYDVIVRFGGDEFICALSNIDTPAVQRRFKDIIATLEANGLAHPISFGVAELEQEDDLEHLLERADGALLEARRSSGHRRA